jgi:hypothetical protein
MLRTQHGRPVHFESTFEFLEDFVHPWTQDREWASEAPKARLSISTTQRSRLLEDLMLGTVATQASLVAFDEPKRARGRQSAFESKPFQPETWFHFRQESLCLTMPVFFCSYGMGKIETIHFFAGITLR